jgi:hypothetical protein
MLSSPLTFHSPDGEIQCDPPKDHVPSDNGFPLPVITTSFRTPYNFHLQILARLRPELALIPFQPQSIFRYPLETSKRKKVLEPCITSHFRDFRRQMNLNTNTRSMPKAHSANSSHVYK